MAEMEYPCCPVCSGPLKLVGLKAAKWSDAYGPEPKQWRVLSCNPCRTMRRWWMDAGWHVLSPDVMDVEG